MPQTPKNPAADFNSSAAEPLRALYDAVRAGDYAATVAAFGAAGDVPRLPFLLAAADHDNRQITAFAISKAKEKLAAGDWQEAASRALEHSIGAGNRDAFTQLLDAGAPSGESFAWVAAARHGHEDMLQELQKRAPQQNLQIEGNRIKAAFDAATGAGKYDAASWLAATYPKHMDGHALKAAARAAIEEGNGKKALFAIRKMEEAVPEGDDARRRIYNALMDDAIKHGMLRAIDYLFGKAQTGYASGMASAAHVDQIDSFTHFVAKAKMADVQIPPIDFETTLIIAADKGSHNMVDALLRMGVNPRIHDDGPLRKAVDRYKTDGFAPIEKMLEYGADANYGIARAREKHPEDRELPLLIARTEARIKAEAAGSFSYDVADMDTLRRHDERLGMSPLHFAALRGLFNQVMAHAGAKLTSEDYMEPNARGETLLAVLERQGQLGEVFNAKYWAGRREAAVGLLGRVSDKSREKLPVEAFLREVNVLTLKKRASGNRFKLT